MFPNPNMFPGFRPQMGMYPQQMQPVPPATPPAPQLMTVTPVTGMAQVEAAQVSFDGVPAFFYDTAQDVICVKQFNPQNGTSPITVYRREPQAAPPQYATVEMVNALAERLDALTAPRAPRRKEIDAE